MNNLQEYIKQAFEFKAEGSYKQAIDYFYKALAIDNNSCEIMSELAYLYSKLQQYDRAVNFYEQVLLKYPDNYQNRFFLAMLYKKQQNFELAKEQLIILFNVGFDLITTTEELFSVLYLLNEYNTIIELYNSRANSLNSSIVYYYTGLAYSGTDRKSIAEEFFKKSFEADENNIESGSRVADILFEHGQYQDAEVLLEKLLKHSENDKIFYLLAEINYLKSDYDNAIKYYTLAIKLNDKNAGYFYKLASTYAIKGFLQEAEENYCMAVTIEHDNLLYNYTLAYLYYMNEKYSLAKRIVDFILSLDSGYIPGLSLNLLILLKENDIIEASKTAEKIKENKEKNEFSYYALSIYYSKLNRWTKAKECISNAILYNEKSCEYNYEMARFCFELKEYDKAEDICKNIISINKKYINAYILLAKIYLSNQDYEKSSQNIDEALKLDMNIPEIYYIKGVIADNHNDNKTAVENYKTALSMAPGELKYYEIIAESYYKCGNYEDAFKYYKEAADIDVSNGEYRYYMAKCSENSGDNETAVSNYSMARRLVPLNIKYVEDYAEFLNRINKKKSAINVVKSAVKLFTGEEKQKLKELIENLKK